FLMRDCDEFLITETMAQRKEQMLRQSEAFVALPGGIGTMDEFFEAITLKQLGLVQGPLILLNTCGFYDRLMELLMQMAEEGFMSANCLKLLQVCDTPEEALEAVRRPEEVRGSIRRLEDYTG
ncbi:MAG: TIGR00730 family Rossman fold protein, partial [Oscillospiraceae bacterium]|nr:TIGR00730 family Rossman fold protein [Oscillospiraceae bacterium]